MIRTPLIPSLLLSLAIALPAAAQDDAPAITAEQQAMMDAYQDAGTPGAAHAALVGYSGDYDLSIRSWTSPTAPAVVESGTATRRMVLEGRVMVEEISATVMGQPFNGLGMHGFDNVTGKHWSTWNDNLSTGLMVSEGSCDDAGTCAFTGSWNDPVTKAKVSARMTTRWTTPTTEVFSMFGPGPDGKEMKMMEITYVKKT